MDRWTRKDSASLSFGRDVKYLNRPTLLMVAYQCIPHCWIADRSLGAGVDDRLDAQAADQCVKHQQSCLGMLQRDCNEPRTRTLVMRTANVNLIVLEVDHDALIFKFVGSKYSLRSAQCIGHDRQNRRAERQISDCKGVNADGRHRRDSRDSPKQDGRRLIERDVEEFGHSSGDAAVICARIEPQAERTLIIDPHRSPNPADLITSCGCGKAWFGCLDH